MDIKLRNHLRKCVQARLSHYPEQGTKTCKICGNNIPCGDPQFIVSCNHGGGIICLDCATGFYNNNKTLHDVYASSKKDSDMGVIMEYRLSMMEFKNQVKRLKKRRVHESTRHNTKEHK